MPSLSSKHTLSLILPLSLIQLSHISFLSLSFISPSLSILTGPRLLICCHVDVPSDIQTDSHTHPTPTHSTSGDVLCDPNAARISGDVLYGRGAADMKGGAAVALQLFADFASQVSLHSFVCHSFPRFRFLSNTHTHSQEHPIFPSLTHSLSKSLSISRS